MKNAIDRTIILNACFKEFHQMLQWGISHHSDNHRVRAESLVNLLEVIDCGSVGGVDQSNPVQVISGNPLYDRFLTVVRKFNDEEYVFPVCGFSITDLTYSFQKLKNDFRQHRP